MEQQVRFDAGGILLEGLLEKKESDKAVIVTHPHPLYGGEMYNDVVDTVRKAFSEKGYTTLRFNFRGTGRSEGRHDDGIGEKEDLAAAVSFLNASGAGNISIAGYSFGAWVSLMTVASGKADPSELFLIAPPVDFITFESVRDIEQLKLVVAGDRDQFGSFKRVETMASQWKAGVKIHKIEGCDHFFSGCLTLLKRSIFET